MDTRLQIERHWALANARQWDDFATLLAPGLRYEVPQTREFADGAAAYLALFRTWPGAWRVELRELVCEGRRAVSQVDFHVDGQVMTGISFFTLDDSGRLLAVTDHWPAPYEPPPRATPLLQRRAAP